MLQCFAANRARRWCRSTAFISEETCVCLSVLALDVLFNFLAAGVGVRMEVKVHNPGVENEAHGREERLGEQCAAFGNDFGGEVKKTPVRTKSVYSWIYRVDLDGKPSTCWYTSWPGTPPTPPLTPNYSYVLHSDPLCGQLSITVIYISPSCHHRLVPIALYLSYVIVVIKHSQSTEVLQSSRMWNVSNSSSTYCTRWARRLHH